jgi:hypothetical protein
VAEDAMALSSVSEQAYKSVIRSAGASNWPLPVEVNIITFDDEAHIILKNLKPHTVQS